MSLKAIHDGDLVRMRMKDLDLAPAQLAAKLNTDERNLYNWFKNENWKTNDLSLAGQILDCDFFSHYRLESPSSSTSSLKFTKLENGRYKGSIDLEIEIES